MTEEDTKEKHFQYVPHHQRQKWEDAGWVFCQDLGPPHSVYSSLYEWAGDGDPVKPDDVDVKIK